MTLLEGKTIAILGGTGPQGRGLARRLGQGGLHVIIGGRSADKSSAVAGELSRAIGATVVQGTDNMTAAERGDVVLITVPWAAHAELLIELKAVLAGKVVVDCVNPLAFDKKGAFPVEVPEGSATEQAAAILSDSTVVGAFHNLSAVLLEDKDVEKIDADVLVLGDERDATDLVQELAGRIPGVRGIYGGRRRNARQVEALTANLISINRRYKAHSGLRVSDL